ncbi:MAG: PA14 domain-containing protein [Pseudomonadota bacterium]
MTSSTPLRWGAAFLGAFLLLAGPVSAASPQPLSPQPAADDLAPGLAVDYYYSFFRHIDELIEWQDYKDGDPGEPILQLDYRVGMDKVLTSEVDNGVGAEISGLIHLEKTGTYAFTAQSNDGVRLEIGGVLVLEDPDVHADRYSMMGPLEVTTPGWYPIKVLYFERKNTSTLELYWQPPGQDGSMELVPAEVFAHLKSE